MSSHDIYPTLSGAAAAWRELEVVANNVANTSTTGFKEHRTSFELVDRGDLPLQSSMVKVNPGGADISDGPIQQTGVQTHLALRGRGFLLAESAEGEQVLVRSGDLRLDGNRLLVTARGEPVLGQGGPIQVPENETLSIAEDGTVSTKGEDGNLNELDRLRFVTAPELEPIGGTRYRAVGGMQDDPDTTVVQGSLEGSNSDAIGGMLRLIDASRHFDIYQRAIRTSDELDSTIQTTTRN